MKKQSNTSHGLMTLEEFLKYQNPGDRYHEPQSYTFTVESLNTDYSMTDFSHALHHRAEFTLYGKSDLSALVFERGPKVFAVLAGGVLYCAYTSDEMKIQSSGIFKNRETYVPFSKLFQRVQKVKYPGEYTHLVSDVVKNNESKFPHLIARFENNGEIFTVRSEREPTKTDEGVTVSIFNGEGYRVATIQDEWGATLLGVAEEYRGRGLSRGLLNYWYKLNPSYLSGGFTPAGLGASTSYWAKNVQDLDEKGLYASMLARGKITPERVNAIREEAAKVLHRSPPAANSTESPPISATGEILMFADYPGFVLYDRAYLSDPQEEFIVGYGLLRASENIGTFYYKLDYERKYSKLATLVALQFAKDNGDAALFDGAGDSYSDYLELDGIPGVRKEGDYILIEKNLIDCRPLQMKDLLFRQKKDPYMEIKYSLLETADSKWRKH